MEFIRKYIILCVALTSVNWTCVFSDKVSCPGIKVPNLRARIRGKGRIVNFQCRNKFQLVGVKFAVCLDSGEWSQPNPICVGTTCHKPELDPNIIVEELYKGGVLKFTCGAGLVRSGPETLMCDGKDWSDQLPKCIEGSTMQCGFEDPELCGWSNDFDDNFDWTWHKGETPTANTGPRFDHTTDTSEGHYMYMESSAPQTSGLTARFLSPPYSPVNTINMCLEFFYHMFGPDGDGEVGDLEVYVKPLALKTTMLQPSQRIFHLRGNQGDNWQPAIVHLPPIDVTFQIVFQATRQNSWAADIAIDDVRLYNCAEETTTSSGPTEVDETDDEDNNHDPPVQTTTERRPQITTSKSTHSATTVRSTLLPTTASTPSPTASTLPTTASTQTTKIIVAMVTTESTTTRQPTSTATSPTPTRSTKSVTPPVVRTTATTTTTTQRSTKTPTSESSTSTTTTTAMPLKTSPKPITISTETATTRTPAATSTRATTATVKLTKPTTVTETSSTSTTTSTTKTTRATTTPVSTTETTSAATIRITTVESTTSVPATNPPSTVPVQTTTYTDNSPTAKVASSTTASVDTEDWSTPKSHATTGIMTFTTYAKDTHDDTGTDNNDADVYEYDSDNTTTPNENDQANDNDEDYHETTKSMSSSADDIYDVSSDNLEPVSTFNKSSGHNDSHPSTNDNDIGNERDENKSSLTEDGKSLSNNELGHRAVRGKSGQSSSSTTDVLPLIIGVAASVVVAALVIAILAYLWARNQKRKQEKEQEDQMNIITEYVETNLSTSM